eukprot:scpid39943/ scgid13909/ 
MNLCESVSFRNSRRSTFLTKRNCSPLCVRVCVPPATALLLSSGLCMCVYVCTCMCVRVGEYVHVCVSVSMCIYVCWFRCMYPNLLTNDICTFLTVTLGTVKVLRLKAQELRIRTCSCRTLSERAAMSTRSVFG